MTVSLMMITKKHSLYGPHTLPLRGMAFFLTLSPSHKEAVVVVVSFIMNSHKMDFTSYKKLYNPVNKNYIQHSFIRSFV